MYKNKFSVSDKQKRSSINSEKNLCAFYQNTKQKTPSAALNRFELYETIRSCKDLQSKTEYIQKKHAKGIKEGFKTTPKTPYQNDKIRLLSAACFAGNYDRSKDISKQSEIAHSGIITLDIDESIKEALESFRQPAIKGIMPSIEALGYSVSGTYTSALWGNIKVDIPNRFKAVPKRIRKLLNLQKSNYKEVLHKAYAKCAIYIIESNFNIKCGSASDLKRLRYITHDSELYVNDNAEALSLDVLEDYLKEKQINKGHKTAEDLTLNINETDAFKFAEEYCRKKGLVLIDGGIHDYFLRFSACCNLLGVKLEDVQKYAENFSPKKITSGCVTYPYEKNISAFGKWAYKLEKKDVKPQNTILIKSGNKLGDHIQELEAALLQQAQKGALRIELQSGTGSGKTFTSVKQLPAWLLALNGAKTLIAFPTNSKTEKDSEQYKKPFITGELLKTAEGKQKLIEALESDVILTNYNNLKNVAEAIKNKTGIYPNIVIDEAHTLPAGMQPNYKPDTILKIWKTINSSTSAVILLSGTPKPYFTADNFTRIAAIQEDRPAINLHVRYAAKNASITVLKHLQDNKKSGAKVVFKIQSKATIQQTKALLLKEGYTKEEILCLYSSKEIKKSKEYKDFISAKKGGDSFNNTIKVVLCTSFINEGIDIYSNDKLHFVSIEKNSCFDVDSFVQFADRHRTDNTKEVYLYIKEDKTAAKLQKAEELLSKYEDKLQGIQDQDTKKAEWLKSRIEAKEEEVQKLELKLKLQSKDFNYLHDYKQAIEYWSKRAEALTTIKQQQQRYTSEVVRQTTKTEFSYNERCLYFDAELQKYCVNHVALMYEAEKIRIENTTKDKGLKEIKERFKYFNTIDETEEQPAAESSQESAAALKKIKANYKAAKQEAQTELLHLFKADKELLLQAIAHHTEDRSLQDSIRQKAERKQEVTALINNKPLVFTYCFDEAELLLKYYLRAKEIFLSDEELLKVLFAGNVFKAKVKVNKFFTDFKIQIGFILNEFTAIRQKEGLKTELLTLSQLIDIRRLKNIKEAVRSRSDKPISNKQLYAIVRSQLDKQEQKSFTQNKATKLINSLFNTKRNTHNLYIIGHERTLSDVLISVDIESSTSLRIKKALKNTYL